MNREEAREMVASPNKESLRIFLLAAGEVIEVKYSSIIDSSLVLYEGNYFTINLDKKEHKLIIIVPNPSILEYFCPELYELGLGEILD